MDEQNENLEVAEQEIDAAWEEEAVPAVAEEEKPSVSGEAAASSPSDGSQGASAQDGLQEGEKEPMGEENAANQPEVFTLKHMDETKQVGKDEVVVLAQKGMDYDRIRTERDQLRTYRQEADPALNLVKTYAQRNGMDVGQYIDCCRKQELMAQGINEQTAVAQVELEKNQAAIQGQNAEAERIRREQESAQQEATRRDEARKQDMSAFLAAYPAVKPEEIPPQVWERVAKGESLMSAYTMHRNAELEAKLAAREQNKQNQQRTPGGLSTTEQKGGKTISDLWDESDV